MANSPGLLGMRPARTFKIFETDFPAIFRFDGKLYMENFDIDRNEHRWVEISEEHAMHYLRRKQRCENPACPEAGWCGGACAQEF